MRNYLVSLLIFIVVLSLFLAGAGTISEKVDEEGLYLLDAATRRATIQCYAIEGQYPQSLEYLTENYGLRIDEDKYFVHYSHLGSNILPDITVMRKDIIDEQN
jgi:hypothetical protein